MPKIKVLPPELVSKIAAGEVVERPSSVVKELVENSIDAGARNIVVEIDLGGAAMIRITDDGCGMTQADASLAVERHATSKLEKFEDLFTLKTLGFRGEALPSIAAVSQFCLRTRTPDNLVGTELNKSASGWQTKDIGCNCGTQVIVKNLFYNVPVRRKFLRSAITEYQHTLELLESFGLLWPQIGLRFVSNGKIIFDWPAQQWPDRCREVIGETFRDFLPINYQGQFKLTGWIGKPVLARPKKVQYLFINNRVVNEFMIARTIKEAYGNLIAKDCYPTFVLKLDLSPDQVDVNVHPRKTEVKIAHAYILYQEIFKVIQAVLNGGGVAAQVSSSTNYLNFKPGHYHPQTGQWPSAPKVFNTAVRQSLELYKNLGNLGGVPGTQEATAPTAPTGSAAAFTVLGQLENSYILVLVKDAILIFDQHAVSERLVYEDLRRANQSQSQRLLAPLTLELSLSEFNVYRDQEPALTAVGWQTEGFGERTILVRAVPTALRTGEAKRIITKLLKDLTVSAAPDDLSKSMACHSAVRFGDILSRPEQEELIKKAFARGVQSCPHGRPVMHKIELEDLHKIFKRRGF